MNNSQERKINSVNHNHTKVLVKFCQQYDLTNREQQVVSYLMKRLSVSEVAEMMHISKETVRFHIKNIFNKTNTNSQKDLALLFLSI